MFTPAHNGCDLIDCSQVALAILAGGEGRRMGKPKSHLRIDGRPILHVLLESFQWPGPKLLVTAPDRTNPPGADRFDREVVDPISDGGPLCGILTALENCPAPYLAVAPVDMLGLQKTHLEWMVDRLSSLNLFGVIPQKFGPFPIALTQSARNEVTAYWNDGNRSVRSLAERPGFAAIETPANWPRETWVNLNTPEEYAAFTARRSVD